ncbi:MAG: PEP-CTERM system TPR-repeat protein PrsT [Rubrivivax sp.]|nr:PEP-CTERM system TPR-repeat protein PrsT [Rubrivivax sp.]
MTATRSILSGFSAALVAAAIIGCSKNPAAAIDRAEQELQAGDHAAAIVRLKDVLQSDPSSARARHVFGTALLQSGEAAGAEIELRRAIDRGHDRAASMPALARALLRQRKYEQVIEQFGTVALDNPSADADLGVSVALSLLATGAPDRALARAQRALDQAPDFEPALLAVARIRSVEGDPDAALRSVDQALQRSPTSVEALQLRGDLLLLAKRDLAGALDSYSKALEVAPGNAALHTAAITVHFARQDSAAAGRQFEAMRKALPRHPLTQFHAALESFKSGDGAEAHRLLQPVLPALQDQPSALFLAGGIDAMRGSLAEAEAHLGRAVSLQPDFDAARQLLAEVQLKSNQPVKALGVLRARADRPDAHADLLATAGRAALLASETRLADSYFARARQMQPTSTKARTTLALTKLASGQVEAALKELQAVAAHDIGVSADLALIGALMGRNEYDKALAAIDALDRKQPQSPVGPELRARVHLARGDTQAAREHLEESVRRKPSYIPAVAALAALDYVDKRPEAARKRFQDLIKADPRNVQAYLSLADLEARVGGGDPQAPAKVIVQAVSANPSDPEARLALIAYHRGRGDINAALSAAQEASAAFAQNSDVQNQLGQTHLASGNLAQAAAAFGKLAVEHGSLAYGPMGLAEVALAKRDDAGALRHARRALEVDPAAAGAQRIVITATVRLGRHDDAVAAARSLQSMWPDDPLGYVLEGEVEAHRSQWDAAARAFTRATQKPNPAQSAGRLHDVLLRGKRADEAGRFAQSWIKDHPHDLLFRLYLADVASKAGDVGTAEQRYREVLERQPDNVLALNNLAWVLARQGRPGAVALAKRAIASAPGVPAFQDTLAMALASERQFADALEVQKKLIARDPDTPRFRVTLARIYMASGDRASARTELQKLAGRREPFAERDEVAQLLKAASGGG